MAPRSNLLPCPRCGSTKRWQILWGLPTGPLSEAQSKRYVLGGCCVEPDVTHQCKECDLRYGARRDDLEFDERLPDDSPVPGEQ